MHIDLADSADNCGSANQKRAGWIGRGAKSPQRLLPAVRSGARRFVPTSLAAALASALLPLAVACGPESVELVGFNCNDGSTIELVEIYRVEPSCDGPWTGPVWHVNSESGDVDLVGMEGCWRLTALASDEADELEAIDAALSSLNSVPGSQGAGYTDFEDRGCGVSFNRVAKDGERTRVYRRLKSVESFADSIARVPEGLRPGWRALMALYTREYPDGPP